MIFWCIPSTSEVGICIRIRVDNVPAEVGQARCTSPLLLLALLAHNWLMTASYVTYVQVDAAQHGQ